MTHHLKDDSINELDLIFNRLDENNIPYSIEYRDGKIIKLETDDIELINYAKKNNPNLR